jgi:hypothetical protein
LIVLAKSVSGDVRMKLSYVAVEFPKLHENYLTILNIIKKKECTFLGEITRESHLKKANVVRITKILQDLDYISISTIGFIHNIQLTEAGTRYMKLHSIFEANPELYEYIRCTKCDELKHVSEFYENNKKHWRLCKKCRAEYDMSRYYKRNKITNRKAVYSPVKPEGTVRRTCPHCKGWIFIDPKNETEVCEKCGKVVFIINSISEVRIRANRFS